MARKTKETKVLKAWQIANAIEEMAPLATQQEWDNSGFSVGGAERDVHKVLIALNCSLEVIEEAVAKGCDMVVTHHPLIIHSPLHCIMDEDLRGKAIITAIKNGITVYSSHTPLDKAKGGINTTLAKMIGVRSPKDLAEGGFGAYGTLQKGMNAKEFIEHIKKIFNAPHIRTSKPIKNKITKIAVSSGGGQGSIKDALTVRAQVLVTGDVTHHNFYLPDGFMVIDLGHHYSEWCATSILKSIINKNFANFEVQISEADTSPIFYF